MALSRRRMVQGCAALAGAVIAASARPPQFPARDFPITRFGAKGDGSSDGTAATAAAIAACQRAGGGRVVVPEGEFATGPIELLAGVELHLEAGATLRFSTDPRRYPLVPTRYEGIELMNYAPLVRAYGQRDIAITGAGTLDGGADWDHWWNWTGKHPGEDRGMARAPASAQRGGLPPRTQDADRALLGRMAEQGVPVERRVFGPGHYLRPQFIQPYRCENVLIEGVRLRRSPMYHLHPVLCRNVTVRGLDIESAGPNTDGCDPESCDGVLIEHCRFATGDDCIALKSGRNADGRRLHTPVRNVVIRNCRMERGHGAVTIGSEISGGARNILAVDCRVGAAVMTALRVKNNALRGGWIENIRVRDIAVERTLEAGITIDFLYEEGAAGPYTPVCRHVRIEKMTVARCRRALELRGLPRAPIEDVVLSDCVFQEADEPSVIRDVRGLRLLEVRVNGKPMEAGETASGGPGGGEGEEAAKSREL